MPGSSNPSKTNGLEQPYFRIAKNHRVDNTGRCTGENPK
jgi:hypothetical protein